MSPAFPSGPQAALVRFAIRFRGIVAALACVLVAYGVYALGRAKYDVFPEFAPPQVSIQTEAVGLTPEQVEILVTRPIENAISGVPGVRTLRSTSIQGLSVVTVFSIRRATSIATGKLSRSGWRPRPSSSRKGYSRLS